MGRKQELEEKLMNEVKELDVLIRQKNEEYDSLGDHESEAAKSLLEEIMSLMRRVNKLLRSMGRGDEGYDL